ncbi:hypothetical protein F442_11168 [Phytophthora nicotianae P10297]|uniref:Uncharacterized protein n=1 Tax=Phytophthora nicotianae P10297 TaxID=1317064 RepID=W2Z6K0_PHYNI|nr:hypothetical protein F442_11168 [Phytophthora nicotianae P10297]
MAEGSQIWHDLWRGGASIPADLKAIRLRAPSRAVAQCSADEEGGDSCCDDGASVASSSARSGTSSVSRGSSEEAVGEVVETAMI